MKKGVKRHTDPPAVRLNPRIPTKLLRRFYRNSTLRMIGSHIGNDFFLFGRFRGNNRLFIGWQ